uniref:Uncharacterized protein n=1 Tax=Monopterus albus TaxID=43700 RepID=A0A3Q3QF80_MONAL
MNTRKDLVTVIHAPLTLSVSMGQTIKMASAIPAPKPHTRLRVLSSRPVASPKGIKLLQTFEGSQKWKKSRAALNRWLIG